MKITRRASTRAQSGIGTLIIFIAIILVASMVASIVMSTNLMLSKDVESKAKSVKTEVATSLSITSVSGRTNSTTGMAILYIVVEPSPGSAPIDLDTLVLQLTLGGYTTKYLTYAENSSYESGHFNVSTWIRMKRASNRTANPFIEVGDLAELCVKIDNVENQQRLAPGSKLVMVLMPENGIAKEMELITPDLYPPDSYVMLYP